MYCHACGTRNAEEASICVNCGTTLLQKDTASLLEQVGPQETAASVEATAHAGTKATSSQGKVMAWIIPILVLGITALSLTLYYRYEMNQNKQVLNWHEQASEKALSGSYKEAMGIIDTALAKRPTFAALLSDRKILTEALAIQEQLAQVATQLKTQKVKEGEKLLKTIGDSLKGKQEPLFEPLQAELINNQTTLAVLKVKAEIDSLNTVDALVEKLESINKIAGEEAKAIAQQIMNKLVDVSYKEAEAKLKKSDFPKALQIVDYGLYHVPDSDKLTDYRKYIVDKRQAFERAEAQRIQLAEQQAAQEELNNQTAAIDLIEISSVLDEYGDLQIKGKIKNVATRPIYDVELVIEIYDLEGNFINQVNAYIDPYYLEPGAKGDFVTTYSSAYTEAEVVATKASWYVD